MRTTIALSAVLLVLAGCGRQSPAENTADRLDRAAAQSDPAAAPVLENAADAMREGNDQASADPAGPAAQNAMRAGGAAQTGAPPAPR